MAIIFFARWWSLLLLLQSLQSSSAFSYDGEIEGFRPGPCVDLRPDCETWAAEGLCTSHYVRPHCPVSCQRCHDRVVFLKEEEAAFSKPIVWTENVQIVSAMSSLNGGVAQAVADGRFEEVQRHTVQQNMYFEYTVMLQDRYELVREDCKNLDAHCTLWALDGECTENEEWMVEHCSLACHTCEKLHIESACPIDPNERNAFEKPGDVNAMFERILEDPANLVYEPTVLSRPSEDPDEDGPWVIVLENFILPDEAERLIELGANVGYARSTEVGTDDDIVTEKRTSTNAWCDEDDCLNDVVTQRVYSRMENLTGISMDHSERLQLLRYEPGQFYGEHHDYTWQERKRKEGVRILTIFLYLNDVEAGGGTRFPKLDVTVQPKVGRALVWPSVLDEEPHKIDLRTNHEALVVESGLKYGANAWLHQRVLDWDCE